MIAARVARAQLSSGRTAIRRLQLDGRTLYFHDDPINGAVGAFARILAAWDPAAPEQPIVIKAQALDIGRGPAGLRPAAHRIGQARMEACCAQAAASLAAPRFLAAADDEVLMGLPALDTDAAAAVGPLQREPLGVRHAVVTDFVARVLQQLRPLHAQGLLHRDIKPANVLCAAGAVDVPGAHRVALGDFGAGLPRSQLPRAALAGTIAYLPPEAIGRGGPLGLGLDAWPLGLTALTLLAGYNPMDLADGRDGLYALLTAPWPMGRAGATYVLPQLAECDEQLLHWLAVDRAQCCWPQAGAPAGACLPAQSDAVVALELAPPALREALGGLLIADPARRWEPTRAADRLSEAGLPGRADEALATSFWAGQLQLRRQREAREQELAAVLRAPAVTWVGSGQPGPLL